MASASDVKKARISIVVDGTDYELIPSPSAIMTLSDKYDGLATLVAAIGRLNIRAVGDTIVAGLGLEGAKAQAMMQTIVSAASDGTALVEIANKAALFASALSNGGRPMVITNESAEGGKNPL